MPNSTSSTHVQHCNHIAQTVKQQHNKQSIPGIRSRTKCVKDKARDRNLKAKAVTFKAKAIAKAKNFGLKAKAKTSHDWVVVVVVV